MIIAVAGQKGGAGKSTVAIHVASEWVVRGNRVLLVDADPQRTTTTWAEVAAELGHRTPDVVGLGDNLRQALPGLASAYDRVVVDCPPRLARRQAYALGLADAVLLPCGPFPADVWALAESADMVADVQALRDGLPRAAVVLNRLRGGTVMSRGARQAVAGAGLAVLERGLGYRVAFGEAVAAGQGVTTYAPGTVAANELRRLVDEIEVLASTQVERVTVPAVEVVHA